MSRSRRHTPVCANTCAGLRHGERWWKRLAWRRVRARVRVALALAGDQADLTMDARSMGNAWLWPKDGKQRFDPIDRPGEMRK